MDKVIQIANICKDMCNVPNPIPGRIYYAKGCAPALNTWGGVENTYVFMDKIKMKFIYKLPHGYYRGGHTSNMLPLSTPPRGAQTTCLYG